MSTLNKNFTFEAASPKISEELNQLLRDLFDGNALIDNMYYDLQSKYFFKLADAIHVPVAHQLPELADEVSDLMTKLDIRAMRYATENHVAKYERVYDVFVGLSDYFGALRAKVRSIINEADMNGDDEVRIWLENFLVEKILPLYKQTREWERAAAELSDHDFNIHIEDYTHFLNK